MRKKETFGTDEIILNGSNVVISFPDPTFKMTAASRNEGAFPLLEAAG
jgi:hypothetical protein